MQELDLQLYKTKHEPGHLLNGGRPQMVSAPAPKPSPKRPEQPQTDEQPPIPPIRRRPGGKAKTGLQIAGLVTTAPPRLKPDPDFIRQLGVLAIKGFTDKEIADVYGVSVKVVRRWAQQYPDFMATLTNARELADDAVERALFARATGYSVPEVVINVGKDGDVTKVDSIKHYPPDVNAAQYWLKNRRGDKWRDRQEVELSGKDGKPLAVVLFAPQMAAGQQAGGAGGVVGAGGQQLGPTDSRDIIEAIGQDDGRQHILGAGNDDDNEDGRQGAGGGGCVQDEGGGDFCGGPYDDRGVDAQESTCLVEKIFQKNFQNIPNKEDLRHPDISTASPPTKQALRGNAPAYNDFTNELEGI